MDQRGASVAVAVLVAVFFTSRAGADMPLCPMVQTDRVPCDGVSSSGAAVNLCGICVSGTTGLPPDTGIDACGVCDGGNRCVGCDSRPGSQLKLDGCGNCVAAHDPNYNNCTRISSVWPPVVDLLLDRDIKLSLIGTGLSHSLLPDISCSILSKKDEKVNLPITLQEVEDDVIELEADARAAASGPYSISCQSSGVPGAMLNGSAEFLIVDSGTLGVNKVEPSTVNVGQSFKIIMTPSTPVLTSVFCFVSEPGSPQPHILHGNVEAQTVTCEPFTPWRATHLTVGIAYTADAAEEISENAATATVAVRAPAPQLVEAALSPDLRQMKLSFDQNVEGPEDCHAVLSAQSLTVVGDGAQCEFVANTLVIKLGETPKLEGLLNIKILGGVIHNAKAEINLAETAQGSITVETKQVLIPKYRISAPSVVRLNKSAEIRLSPGPGHRLLYNWTVDFDKAAASRKFTTQSQRLKLWDSVRAVQRTLRKATRRGTARSTGLLLPLNTTAMLPDVNYIVKVTGRNAAGVTGPEMTHILRTINKSPDETTKEFLPSLHLSAQLFSYADIELLVEAEIIPQTELNWQYQWIMRDSNGAPVHVTPSAGPVLRVAPGTLQGGRTYNVSCTASRGPEALTETLQVDMLHRGLQAVVTEMEIVIGTGQDLKLDASLSYDADNNPGEIKVLWCCRSLREDTACLLAGSAGRLVEAEFPSAMNQPLLHLPKGTLAVGEYKLTANVFKMGQEDFVSASVSVVVVPGHPPEVRILPESVHDTVNPLYGVTVSGTVGGADLGCLLWWEAVSAPGFQPLDLSAELKLGDVLTLEPEDIGSAEREMQLRIPGPVGAWSGLKGDAKYRLRLSAACQNSSGHADIVITTNSPPTVQPLEVKPIEGEAFRTKFLLQTSEAEDIDQPLCYSFGYISEGSSSLPAASSEKFEAYLLLPPGSGIQPFVRVCDSYQLCSERLGTAVHSTPPDSLTPGEVLKASELFVTLLESGQFQAALSVAEPMVALLKQQAASDEGKGLAQGTAEVAAALKRELYSRKASMDSSAESIQSNLDFLDVSVQVVQLLPPHSEQQSLLTDVRDFRDMIDKMDTSGGKKKIRRKRQTKHDNEPLSKELRKLQSFSKVALLIIKNSADEEDALQNMDQLLTYIHKFIHSTCINLKTGSNIHMSMALLNVSAQLVKAGDISATSFSVPIGAPTHLMASVQFGKSVATAGGKNSLCIGSASFQDDYLTALSQKKRTPAYLSPLIERITHVYEFTALKPDGEMLEVEHFEEPLLILLPVIKEVSQGNYLHCGLWHNNVWDLNICQSDGVLRNRVLECHCTSLGNYSVFVTEVPPRASTISSEGAVKSTRTEESLTSSTVAPSTAAVSSATKSSTELPKENSTSTEVTPSWPTNLTASLPSTLASTSTSPKYAVASSTPSSYTTRETGISTRQPGKITSNNTIYNVIFRIEEDFNKTVGKDEKQFEKHLKWQILDQVHEMPSNMIYSIILTNGSIVATLRLVDTDVKTVSVVLRTLVEMLRTGGLKINGTTGLTLSIPPQNITVIQQTMEPPEEQYTVVYAVSGTVAVTLAAVVTAVATATFVRRQTEKKRIQLIQETSKSSAPMYRKFEFEQTLEGTAESLARYRTAVPALGSLGTTLGTVISGVKYSEPAYFLDHLNGTDYDKNRNPEKTDTQQLVEKAVIRQTRNGSVDLLPGTPTDD